MDYQTLLSSLQGSPLSAAERADSHASFNDGHLDWLSPSVSDSMVQQAYQAAWGRAAQPWEVDAWQGTAGDGALADPSQMASRIGMTPDQYKAAGGTGAYGSSATAAVPQFQQNNPGMSAPGVADYQKNPYLDQMAAGITSQMNDNWTRNIQPGLRSGAMATGGFGGSRQGVVEANGANDMNRSLSQNLTNLYGTDYTNSQNRNLQKYGMDQSYNLGMANNNLGYANLDSNNAQFGANLGLNTMNAQTAWANNGVSAANGISQQPINYFNTFANNANTSGGLGGTGTSTTGSTTNGLSTGLGMGMAVDLLGNKIGGTSSSPAFGTLGNSSFGSGQY